LKYFVETEHKRDAETEDLSKIRENIAEIKMQVNYPDYVNSNDRIPRTPFRHGRK
jgi:hypothetical protein